MDETGEDYTEMMCISCGEYLDKDFMICPFCDYHYRYIKRKLRSDERVPHEIGTSEERSNEIAKRKQIPLT